MNTFLSLVRSVLPLVLLLQVNYSLQAQQAVPKNHSRQRFAQSILGISLQVVPGIQTTYHDREGIHQVTTGAQLYPRLHFGGMHFWGHTELYFSFPIAHLTSNKKGNLTFNYAQNDVFGFRYFPIALQRKKLIPFIGTSLSGFDYSQKVDSVGIQVKGPKVTHITFPLQAGLNWQIKKSVWELNLTYNYKNAYDYYIDKLSTAPIKVPAFTASITCKLIKDGTRPAERDYYSGATAKKYQTLKTKSSLNSWYVGIGPSSSFFMQRSSFNKIYRPFLGSLSTSNAFFEPCAGYFIEKPGIHFNVSYRKIKAEVEAYHTRQLLTRSAITVEAHKQLLDYHGFVPFAGIAVSFDKLKAKNVDDITNLQAEQKVITPGIVAGWDILPDKLQYLTLRTNLRYFPIRKMNVANSSFSFSQIEFNFIQLIVYPQRWKAIQKK